MKTAVPLLLLFVCAPFMHAQEPAALSVSEAEEIRIGHVLADKFEQVQGMAPTPQSMHIDAYLQTVGDRVAAHAQRKLSYQFHFDPDPTFRSAIGLPGGQVFVGAGLLAFVENEDQLAVVLGHEIEHIALNQCRDRLNKVLADQHLSPSDASKLNIGDFLVGYGLDAELQADREGARLAMASGYSVSAAVRLLQTFLVVAQDVPHDPTDYEQSMVERIDQMAAMAKEQMPVPPETPFGLH
jgi:beta-barrel assembly-enhancing protease